MQRQLAGGNRERWTLQPEVLTPSLCRRHIHYISYSYILFDHESRLKRKDEADRKQRFQPSTQCLRTLAPIPRDDRDTTGQYRIHAPHGLQLQGLGAAGKNRGQRFRDMKYAHTTTHRSDTFLIHCFLKARKVYYRRCFRC